MRKSLFLCAFLFVSMQIHAQLYIVETWDNFTYQGVSGCYIVVHSPLDTEPIYVNLGVWDGSDMAEVDRWHELHNVLNGIMSLGYKLLPTQVSTNGQNTEETNWGNNVYFLAVP